MVALLLALSAFSFCQRMPIGITARMSLLMYPDVKKELKISKDQDKQLQAMLSEFAKNAQSGQFTGGLDMSNLMGGLDPKIEAILDEGQNKRLHELFVQVNGGFALTDAKTTAALELSDDQKARAKTLGAEIDSQLMDLMASARSPNAFKGVQTKRGELAKSIEAVLDGDQAVKFALMAGKPYKFKG